MKSFTDLFIKRPVLAMVVSFVILIAGLQAMKTITVRQYPRSDIASITVTTVYVGADAELVRGFITTPLERAIAAADGIDYIQSQSQQGVSTITARLKLNYDAHKALSDISSRVDAIRRDLPPESQIPVIAIQAADSQFAAAYLSFTSDILQPNEVTDYLVRLVQPRLTAVSGVQKADILGGRTFAMRIWMKPERMAALNISPSDVRSSLSKNNYLAAVGSTKGSLLQVNLTANTDLPTAADFKTLIDTLLIVMVVIFLFLGSFRSVIIPIVAIPISLIGALFLMQVFGFTINLLTLLAIVLSVGLVVDDAIVVVENIERHISEGMSRMNAALVGARELIGPIIAMTMTLAAAVFISGVVALVLSPMMSSYLLPAHHVETGFKGWVDRTFDRIRESYGKHLDRTLNARPAVYIVWAGISALAILMFIAVP